MARAVVLQGAIQRLKVLCVREFQVSIKNSFFAELKAAILSNLWLESRYDIGESYIKCRTTGSEFIFYGLRKNIQSIKSLQGVNLTIIEEAEDSPEYSYIALLATVFRTSISEIWAIWNPRDDGSPTDRRFIKTPPPRSLIVKVNHSDNPFFPDGLRELMEHDRKILDVNTFAHVWEGEYLKNQKAQVIADKVVVRQFKPERGWDGPYFGADWGFAVDPTALVKLWINDGVLYVEKECGGARIDIDKLPALFDKIPEARKHVIRADKARPEIISHMQRKGFRITGADKWPGCKEERAIFLRSFSSIVIAPECQEAIKESRLWMYKVNKAGDVLPELVDAYDHYWDAIGYGLTPLIRQRTIDATGYNPVGV